MQNRLKNYIKDSNKKLLTVYFTAGYPKRDSIVSTLNELGAAGVDLVEVGIPFSDSLVDGPTIQASNTEALSQGISMPEILQVLKENKAIISTKFVLMGSYNPILQFGVAKFVEAAAECGALGVIIPDLPPEVYEKEYKALFESKDLGVVFLVTSRTAPERVRYLDSLTNGFIYAVSSDSTTGNRFELDSERRKFFTALQDAKLNNPILVGFGISDKETFSLATELSQGAVIGSAFIRSQKEGQRISDFIKTVI